MLVIIMWVWFSCCHVTSITMSVAAVSHSPSSSLPVKKSGEGLRTSQQWVLWNVHYDFISPAGLTASQPAETVRSQSSLTKHAPLPPINAPSASSAACGPVCSGEDERNPFLMPPESELFTLRERQRRLAKELRAEQRKLKVHEKSTYSSRLNKKNASLRKKVSRALHTLLLCMHTCPHTPKR